MVRWGERECPIFGNKSIIWDILLVTAQCVKVQKVCADTLYWLYLKRLVPAQWA